MLFVSSYYSIHRKLLCSGMPRNLWTRDQDVELARRYMAGEQVELIAAKLSRTASMITTRASTLGLRRRPDATGHANGNATWIIGAALRSAFQAPDEQFGEDLLSKLS